MRVPLFASAAWTIYYGDGETVSGEGAAAWASAPSENVQVVVLWEPPHWSERPWAGVDDRKIWTGEDVYDPFGWGPKHGKQIDDAEYAMIAHRAFYDPKP